LSRRDSVSLSEIVARLAAGDLETVIIVAITNLLDNPASLSDELGMDDQLHLLKANARVQRDIFARAIPSEIHQFLLAIELRVIVHGDNVDARYAPQGLVARLDLQPLSASTLPGRTALPMPDTIPRRMHGSRLILENAASTVPVQRDGQLIALLLKAQQAKKHLIDGLATDPTYSGQHLSRLARLAFLAPDITAAILDGTQPSKLTARQLLRVSELPLSWHEQRRALGFA
jgi:site-specific DNA recombinase